MQAIAWAILSLQTTIGASLRKEEPSLWAQLLIAFIGLLEYFMALYCLYRGI